MILKYFKKIIISLPTLTPIDGKTWSKKFYRLSIINFLLSMVFTILMVLDTSVLGIFLSNFLFLGTFFLLLINDVNFFIINMERLLDADLNPFFVFPLFLFSLLILYTMKLIVAQIITSYSVLVGIGLLVLVSGMNFILYRYLPSKNSTLSD